MHIDQRNKTHSTNRIRCSYILVELDFDSMCTTTGKKVLVANIKKSSRTGKAFPVRINFPSPQTLEHLFFLSTHSILVKARRGTLPASLYHTGMWYRKHYILLVSSAYPPRMHQSTHQSYKNMLLSFGIFHICALHFDPPRPAHK